MFGSNSFSNRQPLRIFTVFVMSSAMLATATPPSWWSNGNPPVIDLGASPDNHGMANIGQAKWMVSEALRALDATAPQIAASIRSDLNGTSPSNRIVDLAVPDPKAPEWLEKQKSPLLVGQLKALAAPFYDRLNITSHDWLDHESSEPSEKGQLQLNGTKDHGPGGVTNIHPWTSITADDVNQSPATIGQLKAVFSLRYESLPPAARDADNDGMADSLEKSMAGEILASQPDPASWGTYYAGLVAGNLEAAHDYTGEGMSVSELLQGMKDIQEFRPPFNLNFVAQIRGRWDRTITKRTFGTAGSPDSFLGVLQISKMYEDGFAWYSTDVVTGSNIITPEYLESNFANSEYTEFSTKDPDSMSFRVISGSDGYAVSSSFETTAEIGGIEYIGRNNQVQLRCVARTPHHEAFSQDYLKVTTKNPEDPDREVLDVTPIKIQIPSGKCLSPWMNFKAPMTVDQNTVIDLEAPYVVALAPMVPDEEGHAIPGSEQPSSGAPLTPFVEVDPATNKVAHRELLVNIGRPLRGKHVTWSLEAMPGAVPATRLEPLAQSPTHKDRFEASTSFYANTFRRVSQEQGETTVAESGYTAIRVNVPPFGFNQVRIYIQIEGTSTPIKLVDMEVPGVVVIDPGHGGTTDKQGSSWNNAESPSGVLEKTMTLDYGLALRASLRAKREQEKINLRVFMTRDSDANLPGSDRAAKARDNGADVLFVLHFNSDDDQGTAAHPRVAHQSRGTLEVYRTTNNVFPQEDADLSSDLIDRMVTAMSPFDAGVNHRTRVAYGGDGVNGPAISSDLNNGNTTDYHPIRTAYIEGEFIDFGANTASDHTDDAVDILLNTGSNAAAVKVAITGAIGDGILQNLRDQP